MSGTTVPEAAVHKHCELPSGEGYIDEYRPPVVEANRKLDPEPQPRCMKGSAQLNLGTRVLASIRLHDRRSRRAGRHGVSKPKEAAIASQGDVAMLLARRHANL
jgi:hypothetical protein